MSPNALFMNQAEPEVWLVLDGRRVLARLRAAGPCWMHVFIDGAPPTSDQIPFTVVLRGADGGVVDGLSCLMSSGRREDRTVLRLRLTHLSTSGHHALLKRFVADILGDAPSPIKMSVRHVDAGALRALHHPHRSAAPPDDGPLASDLFVVSMPAVWRLDATTTPAHIIKSSASGRCLVVRRRGPPPSAWETVRLEMDLGVGGEPRPVQLVGMVIGTVTGGDAPGTDVIVRLVRWSADSDRAAWARWIRHQQHRDTSLVVAALPSAARPRVETRTAPRPDGAGPPT